MTSWIMNKGSNIYIHKPQFSALNCFVHFWTFLILNASRNTVAINKHSTRSCKNTVKKMEYVKVIEKKIKTCELAPPMYRLSFNPEKGLFCVVPES